MSQNNPVSMQGAVCPLPLAHQNQIVIGHGSGGRMTQELIQRVFYPYLRSDGLLQGNDAARLAIPSTPGRLAISTDSHIVAPLIFPGGDIGRLAI
ncbi:MAG TPA: hydrogenase expression/formation protein HypE, partial [Anaerolineaceae bacterium]|nr:hydrogenase expression/formation protein HypE [Anaerolineaceae bacterium]